MTETAHNTRYPIDGRAERILDAAFTEFTRRGVQAARLSGIARQAGVSLATLRQYFPSKEELFREVIRSAIVHRIFGLAEQEARSRGQPVADGLREFGRQFWRTMAEPDQAALLRLSIGELPAFPDLAVFHASEVVGRAVSRLEALLCEGVRRGEIRLVDIRTAARVLIAAFTAHALWFAYPDIFGGLTGPDRERSEEAVLDFLIGALSEPVR